MSTAFRYQRPWTDELVIRLREPRRFLQVVAGSQQVGKTTLAEQAAERSGLPARYASADEPTLRGGAWIEQQWEAARGLADAADAGGALLVLDEVQKVPRWPETVKRSASFRTPATPPRWPTTWTCSPARVWSPGCRSTPGAPPGGARRAPSSRSSTPR